MINRIPANICAICEKYETDGVKTGNWAYDDICAICISKQIKYEKRQECLVPENYPKGIDLECFALGLLVRKLTGETK